MAAIILFLPTENRTEVFLTSSLDHIGILRISGVQISDVDCIQMVIFPEKIYVRFSNSKIGHLVFNHSKTGPVFRPQYIGNPN